MEQENDEIKIIGKRKTFKSLFVRNIPISLFNKMEDVREKEGLSYSHQMRLALRFWFENRKDGKI